MTVLITELKKGTEGKEGAEWLKVKDWDGPAPMEIRANPGSIFFFFLRKDTSKGTKDQHFNYSKA